MTATTTRSELAADLDRALQDATADGAVAGATLAVADLSGELYSGAAGKKSLAHDAPALPDSTFWIASFTKLFTAIAALQLVEQDVLSLDDLASRYVPAIGDLEVVERNGDGFTLRDPATQVTVRQLLNHTAGGSYSFFNALNRDYSAAENIPGILALSNDTLFAPLVHDPGTDFEYGANIDLLGRVLEEAAGTPLAELYRTGIIEPLGLTDTSATPSAAQRDRALRFHGRGEDGKLAPLDLEIPTDGDFYPGGHALFSTASDYLKVLRALLGKGELNGVRILSEESVAAGLSNQLGDIRWHPITSADPTLTLDVDPLAGHEGTWGYFGLINLTDGPNERSVGSSFWAGLANSYWWLDVERGLAGVVATQTLPFADPHVLALQGAAEAALIRAQAD
ncbi:methyl acetate hydrolase [Rhodococcus sp. 27YEA15]|uniref:serine hydrolase domain-containing protein n=1 Tax=Rhodococcus sp. 27YEA15 TaxID=3156259 RepID=UPI003C7C6BFD